MATEERMALRMECLRLVVSRQPHLDACDLVDEARVIEAYVTDDLNVGHIKTVLDFNIAEVRRLDGEVRKMATATEARSGDKASGPSNVPPHPLGDIGPLNPGEVPSHVGFQDYDAIVIGNHGRAKKMGDDVPRGDGGFHDPK